MLSKLALEYGEYAKDYEGRYIGRVTRQKAEILLRRFAESTGENLDNSDSEKDN